MRMVFRYIIAVFSVIALSMARQTVRPFEANPAALNVTGAAYEVGRVWLISGDTEYKPGELFLHGAMYSDGYEVSISGIPFEFWLDNNLDNLPEIQYSPDIQIFIEGEYGQIVTFTQEHLTHGGEPRLIGLLAEDFNGGMAVISLPYEAGTYLVYVDAVWSGAADEIAAVHGFIEFTLIRYVFVITK